jgi:hypothetical protein
MRIRNCKLEVIGLTNDKKLVIKNIFGTVESRGIPLELCIDILFENNCVIDWYDFIKQGLQIWNGFTLYLTIENGINNCMIYTLEEKKLIIKYIKFLLLKEIQKNNY